MRRWRPPPPPLATWRPRPPLPRLLALSKLAPYPALQLAPFSMSTARRQQPLQHRPVLLEPELPPVEMRDYQKACIDECLEALARGVTRMGASLPTGSGKTTIFVNLIHAIPPRQLPNGSLAHSALIIVNGIELARQTVLQLKRLFPHTQVELEQGKMQASGTAEVTVATIQTLTRGGRLDKFRPEQLKCIIVDEAHHAVAKSYREVLNKFHPAVLRDEDIPALALSQNPSSAGAFPNPEPALDSGIDPLQTPSPSSPPNSEVPHDPPSAVPIIGFSATFGRHDRMALSAVFEEIVYHHELADMIETGWLSPVRFTSISVDLDLSSVQIRSSSASYASSSGEVDYVPSSLAEVVDTPTINDLIVSTWQERAFSEGRKSTLVFAVDVQHVRHLAESFERVAGVEARWIVGETAPRIRREILDDFRAGKFPVLVNCAVLTEGADMPNIDCVYLARPTRSRSFLTQMVGRGLRLSPSTGKEDCLVMDILGSVTRGMVVRPSLEGLSPAEIFQSAGDAEQAAEAMAEEEEQKTIPTRTRSVNGAVSVDGVTYTDYDSPFAIEQEFSGLNNMHHLSQNSWVGCGDDVFVLDLMGHGQFTVQPGQDDLWDVTLTRRFKDKSSTIVNKSRFATPMQIARCRSLAESVSAADVFAASKLHKVTGMMPAQQRGLYRWASWRKERASGQQLEVLRKRLGVSRRERGGPVAEGGEAEKVRFGGREWDLDLDSMTKGQAANLLTRLANGAKKRWEDRTRLEKRETREREKERQLQESGRVTVGKLARPVAHAPN